MLPSELNIGGNSAPLMRLFCFKENTTAQDSMHREVYGRRLCDADKSWAFFIYQNNIGGSMSIHHEQCEHCFLSYGPLDHLSLQFTKFSFAIKGTVQILKSEEANIPATHAFGLDMAWDEFQTALERYIQSKGEDSTLIMGDKS